jgi:glycosyltransferase involved in cell wall biosynthesis
VKRIAYLTFYFQPDLCAATFRNTPLAIELAEQASRRNIIIDLYTTLPHRYNTFYTSASEFEDLGNLKIHRIPLPPHKSGMLGQVFSFIKFYSEVLKLNKDNNADLVFASSSRLFTAFLGYRVARKLNVPLYLDIRDIFVDTMNDVIKSKVLKFIIVPFLVLIERKTFNYAKHINLISGGFRQYFAKFSKSNFTFYTNGIDEEFLSKQNPSNFSDLNKIKKTIVYAGNIGEGQGLHKIIPHAAKRLGNDFEFLIIGDGSNKKQLQNEIDKLALTNIILHNPVNRIELQSFYRESDFLFLHLNDYPAFRKVLPSKIFELATFNKPILAGVSGYAADFIQTEVAESFVFDPCNVDQLVYFLKNEKTSLNIDRIEFKNKYRRSNINTEMAASILSYL